MGKYGQCSINVNMCIVNSYCPANTTDNSLINCLPCDSNKIQIGQGCNCINNIQFNNCVKCIDNKCEDCLLGYFLNNQGICIKCEDKCSICQSETFCMTCDEGFALDIDANICYPVCTSNIQCQDTNNGYCNFDNNYCKPCQNNCKICLSEVFCVQCD
ncbi:Cysteine-rich protein [Spironucleus salmonicida]|uniref:Cysteine-rich protein n=1 Tax=Spironucleus salmonicida TaxID=348837 RepID=V6LSS3_9EUKA|nr:Cysteine-rich protein [Spironucleus salmonicida]|eukprot:EST46736.1 Cysteine-rich protein [Spironucleus salmonicida]